MSRHRNVRTLNYAEEYAGYDDVYGHSVEDDIPMSPSVDQYLYDRSRSSQMSSFFEREEEPIQEEDEDECEKSAKDHPSLTRHDSAAYQYPALGDIEEAKLKSCLDEVRNIVGDVLTEKILVDAIIKHNFDLDKSLNEILNLQHGEGTKPQREQRRRDRGGINRSEPGSTTGEKTTSSTTQIVNKTEQITLNPPSKKPRETTPVRSEDSKTVPSVKKPVTVSSVSSKKNIVKGFAVPTVSEVNGEKKDAEPTTAVLTPSKTGRFKDKTVSALDEYKKDRGKTKASINLVVIGHVDAGKSTLMGHVLYLLGQVNKKVMHKFEQESKKLGKPSFAYAWVLDETGEERTRGITMDVGHSRFETPTKVVTLLDAPGHKDFIPNMITGAAQADVAVLVVNSTRGEFETGFETGGQTREHTLLVRSLGVSQLAVAVNKLDTVEWSEERYKEITKKLGQFIKQAGYKESDVTYIPCSGLTGENLVKPASAPELVKWYEGPTLIDIIDKFRSPERPVQKPLRLTVSDVFKGTGSGFCIGGKVETGYIQVGDKVLVAPKGEVATVKGIQIDEVSVQSAFAGDHVTVTLAGVEMQTVLVGCVLCDCAHPIRVTTKIEARIVLFNIEVPITKGFPVVLHYQSLSEQAVITKLISQLSKSSGEVLRMKPRCLAKSSNAVVRIETSRPVCMELYKDVKELGRFMLRQSGATIAAGLVTEIF